MSIQIPAWLQAAADELAEAAVGTPEAAERLIALADVLLPLELVPVVGEYLEVASDALLRVGVEKARAAWEEAQQEEARKARVEARAPFLAAAVSHQRLPLVVRRRGVRWPTLAIPLRDRPNPGSGADSGPPHSG